MRGWAIRCDNCDEIEFRPGRVQPLNVEDEWVQATSTNDDVLDFCNHSCMAQWAIKLEAQRL